MLEAGHQAPDFTLLADDGSEVSLGDFRGKKVVLYFYPKDNTSGCTTQACDLRDAMEDVTALGAVVLGVSPDSQRSHERFKSKYDLNFPLLVDEDHSVAEAYGTWVEKSMYGKKYMGIERSTFIIDEDGNLEAVWRKVKAKEHAQRLKEYLET
ncbi:MAG: thioredoxin-dependent thiol peroxidase [Gemmatimonadales bacterium]|jgi:peroxiredoxin Q/BCP|nr:MAG: thioredoxin-dependent thiol peroxidase [Gemmatimonadales bacterium]